MEEAEVGFLLCATHGMPRDDALVDFDRRRN